MMYGGLYQHTRVVLYMYYLHETVPTVNLINCNINYKYLYKHLPARNDLMKQLGDTVKNKHEAKIN